MLSRPFAFKALGGVALAALTSAGVLTTGCSSESNEPASAGWTNQPVQASQKQAAAPAPKQSQLTMAFPTGNRNTSDLLVEQIGEREARAGKPYTYQLRVTNLTNQPLSGVVLRQRIPENFKLSENSSVQAAGENGQAQINIGDLGPRQSKTVQVTGTPSGTGTLDTCLSAQYNPPTLCARVPIVAPTIKVVAQGPSQADVCQDLTYRYTVTNTGTGTASNVVLQENLPEGLQTADGQRTVSMNIGDLPQGQSKTVTARLKAMQAGRFTTQAVVHSDAGDVQSEQVATSVVAPRLAVTMTGPKEDYLGQPITYQVTVKNTGDTAARNTRLRLGATPGQVQFVNAQGADGAQLASERQGTGQDLGTIAPGESRTITVNFQPQREGATSVNATAVAQCAQEVTTYANTNIKAVTAAALVVTHDPDPVPVGGKVIYHLAVQNKGTATDHNVQVKATLPDSEQFVRAGGKTEATNQGQTVTFGAIPELQPKQTISWEIEAKATRPDEAKFQATMTSQSTQHPAVKMEPTKLIGGTTGTETHTNQAPEPTRTNPPVPPAPPQSNQQ